MDLRKEITEILKDDAMTPHATIAAMVGTTVEEVEQEIAAMLDEKVILRYAALINTEKISDEEACAEALVELTVMPEKDYGYEEIAKHVYRFDEVKSVFLMSGRYDIAVRVEAKTHRAICKFVWEKLAPLHGVTGTQTLFIMKKYKEYGTILIENETGDRLVVTA